MAKFSKSKIMIFIPNLITISRLISSFILLLTEPLSVIFNTVYILCGVSDALDGYIARRTNTSNQLGALLDSISDAVFFGIISVTFFPLLKWSCWMLFWIGGIAFVRFASLITGFAKYKKVTFIHTYANKATGFILFCSPFLYSIFGMTATLVIVCSLASVSAIEELAINIVSDRLDRDIESIIFK